MKNAKSVFQVMPAETGRFDLHIMSEAKAFLLIEIRDSARPTLDALADATGINRHRLTRLLKALDLWNEYKSARPRAFKKTS